MKMQLPTPPENADLYRFDGRNYEISEEDGVLTLELRRSVRWEWFTFSMAIWFCVMVGWLVLNWSFEVRWPTVYSAQKGHLFNSLMLWLISVFGIGTVGSFAIGIQIGEVWTFDKSAAKVQVNTLEIADFSKIRVVRAWRRGSRFYLALELKNKQTAKLGHFAFARSEYAWRQDAAQIAHFLRVPLEIPPALPE